MELLKALATIQDTVSTISNVLEYKDFYSVLQFVDLAIARLKAFRKEVVKAQKIAVDAKQIEDETILKNVPALNQVSGSITGENIEGKQVIISPRFYKAGFLSPDSDRRFLATGGFGVNPDSIGRAVFGIFLEDGEKNRINRGDILGFAKNPMSDERVKTRSAEWDKKHKYE